MYEVYLLWLEQSHLGQLSLSFVSLQLLPQAGATSRLHRFATCSPLRFCFLTGQCFSQEARVSNLRKTNTKRRYAQKHAIFFLRWVIVSPLAQAPRLEDCPLTDMCDSLSLQSRLISTSGGQLRHTRMYWNSREIWSTNTPALGGGGNWITGSDSQNIINRIFNLGGKKKGKAISVRGLGGPSGWETSRLPHFLDNRITDGGEVVSLMSWPPFTPRKIPGTHFCSILSGPQGHSAAGRIR
jgi:hypothetical protein